MKNKETPASHYNLLPNQGHAVSIAMKLYIYNPQDWKMFNFMMIAPQ